MQSGAEATFHSIQISEWRLVVVQESKAITTPLCIHSTATRCTVTTDMEGKLTVMSANFCVIPVSNHVNKKTSQENEQGYEDVIVILKIDYQHISASFYFFSYFEFFG